METVTATLDELAGTVLPLLGIGSIAAELASQGVPAERLFEGTGLSASQLADSSARISLRQRLALYENALKHSVRPDTALRAGMRRRISDFGIFGYALASSATLRDALKFAIAHLSLSGPTMQVRCRFEADSVILSSHGFQSLGPVLPFAAEFWRSSHVTLMSRVMEAPVQSRLMIFPYRAPQHWQSYRQILNCPVEFVEGVMEWHLPAAVLDQPCPGANPITAQVSQTLCKRMVSESTAGSSLVRRIRMEYVNSPDHPTTAEEMADKLHLSVRSMFRHLAAEGTSYQEIVDDMRRKLAMEYLRDTSLSTEEVGGRLGFSDASTFRRAFKRWSDMTPATYRQSVHVP